jgi:hypothetical protein
MNKIVQKFYELKLHIVNKNYEEVLKIRKSAYDSGDNRTYNIHWLDEEHLREKKSQLESKLGISPQKAGQ